MEKSIKKELIRLEISDLHPYERNPRKIPQEAIDDVKESYIQCGVIDPIEIDENNVILSGHTRRLAALDLGLKEVDVLRVTGLTEEQKRKYRILANKTNEKSGWDFELLDWELEDLDFEGYDFGFEGFDAGNVDDLFEDAEPKEPKKKTVICPHCGEEFELE
jgi:ParB-like chromosome segregation protein Spo0J